MNILMIYQSVVDMCASFLTVVIAVVKVDGTGLSRESSYDQFVCQVWLTRQTIWYFVTTSTYGILLTALDRYAAVLHPIWYNSHVRTRVSDCNHFNAFGITSLYYRRLLYHSTGHLPAIYSCTND